MPAASDANIYGDVFGGWIMTQVDVAGAIPAARRGGGRGATVAVEIYAQPQRLDADVGKVAEAVLTYVATDDARQSCPLSPL